MGIGDAHAVTLSPPGGSARPSWPRDTVRNVDLANFARSAAVTPPDGLRGQRNRLRARVHSLWTTLSTPVDNFTYRAQRSPEKPTGPATLARDEPCDSSVPLTPAIAPGAKRSRLA